MVKITFYLFIYVASSILLVRPLRGAVIWTTPYEGKEFRYCDGAPCNEGVYWRKGEGSCLNIEGCYETGLRFVLSKQCTGYCNNAQSEYTARCKLDAGDYCRITESRFCMHEETCYGEWSHWAVESSCSSCNGSQVKRRRCYQSGYVGDATKLSSNCKGAMILATDQTQEIQCSAAENCRSDKREAELPTQVVVESATKNVEVSTITTKTTASTTTKAGKRKPVEPSSCEITEELSTEDIESMMDVALQNADSLEGETPPQEEERIHNIVETRLSDFPLEPSFKLEQKEYICLIQTDWSLWTSWETYDTYQMRYRYARCNQDHNAAEFCQRKIQLQTQFPEKETETETKSVWMIAFIIIAAVCLVIIIASWGYSCRKRRNKTLRRKSVDKYHASVEEARRLQPIQPIQTTEAASYSEYVIPKDIELESSDDSFSDDDDSNDFLQTGDEQTAPWSPNMQYLDLLKVNQLNVPSSRISVSITNPDGEEVQQHSFETSKQNWSRVPSPRKPERRRHRNSADKHKRRSHVPSVVYDSHLNLSPPEQHLSRDNHINQTVHDYDETPLNNHQYSEPPKQDQDSQLEAEPIYAKSQKSTQSKPSVRNKPLPAIPTTATTSQSGNVNALSPLQDSNANGGYVKMMGSKII